MLRTWVNEAGAEYAPYRVPAFWRRVADRHSWQEAERLYGPLDGDLSPPGDAGGYLSEDWRAVHGRLMAIAHLWRPVPQHPTTYLPADWATLRRNEAARCARSAIQALVDADQLVADVSFVGWLPELKAETLRAFIWADLGMAIGHKVPYRRCGHCTEWFVPARSDALFCTGACKQAAYAARQADA
jgi:hypothetical protein